ncbi:pentatricopeptide repeat-containing protein At5g46460, mitochondrial [Elaeis guineensis]|uniref:Pentatricopeptide repeat-containing protein At5g46460, mitochondrial n=1 Tax=Elaeis guineensis var. tenera TaxID=51953 RepID=A0A6I9QXB8_ELAGV|nr:pentatricopeptide repeat-containing protein At5g46460, mitochondrial [Elaeis guineensis]
MKRLPAPISNRRPSLSHLKRLSLHGPSTTRHKNFPPSAASKSDSKEGSSHWKAILSHLLRNNEIDEARHVFSKISSPDAHLYTMMITGYARIKRIDEAFRIFTEMPTRDVASWNSMIKACLDCGDLHLAGKLFDEMPERNVISWTTIMNGLAQVGQIDAAEGLFWRMPQRDTAAWNSMISGYSSNGRVTDARLLFEKMPCPNVISWTAMIGGYDQNGESDEALHLFEQMWALGIKPTSSTYACVLTACANVADLGLGTQLHAHLSKVGYLSDTFVSTSLLTLYANCKHIENSSKLFHENGDRNLVSWTALITAYGLNGRHEDALDEFNRMILSGIRPNQSTFTSALNSCCGLESLDQGKKIHGNVIKLGLDSDVFVGNSLIVLYSKCGDIDNSLMVFNNMRRRNLVSWNSIIVGCAQNGYALWALKLFDDMKSSLEQPDEITYVGLLTACSHSRMIASGKQIFQQLKEDPLVDVKLEHYACMVDVLGRCGNLEEAEDFISSMPMKPNVAVWLALLSACRMHTNLKVARRASQKIFDLDPYNSAAYVLLSNIYASAGKWNDVSQTRVMMRSRGIVKIPGYSWITLKDSRHEFVCGDRSHPMTTEIYKKLDWLGGKLKEYGYVYDRRFALHDVDDEQKEVVLTYHSEKLAIAFALLSTVQGSTIRIMKNLRVCGDCHSSIKVISRIVGREIVLRDSSRFHHFRDGLCSCGDYW